MHRIDNLKFEPNGVYYYFDQKIVLIRIINEIHMAKVKFFNSEKEYIVDIKGICEQPICENSISLKLLGGK